MHVSSGRASGAIQDHLECQPPVARAWVFASVVFAYTWRHDVDTEWLFNEHINECIKNEMNLKGLT